MMVFTRDLRLTDNPALAAAAAAASTTPLFVLDDTLLDRCREHASRLSFLLDSLRDLDAGLRRLGGALIIRRGNWVQAVLRTASEAGAGTIHVADDVSGYAQARLARLERAAAGQRLTIIRQPGLMAVPAGVLRPPGARFYQIFTPYYRRWRAAQRRELAAVPARLILPAGIDPGRLPHLAELSVAPPAPGSPAGGESAGLARLRYWAASGLAGYDRGHEELAADRSSRLSPFLHLGCLSPRTLETELAGRRGSEAFLRQLAWRDFFCQLLAARPDAGWQDFRSRGDEWNDDSAALQAWQAGQTGFPVVDAGMRQLAAEGFLPNRARMIVASFLAKDLYLDWRQGAAHFMAKLADADVACNQLNWQWVAGTGTDTSPHRIFNPTVQGRRFDPGGGYVRRYVPELAALPARAIHDPDCAIRRSCGYPQPLVDHQAAAAHYRERRRRPPVPPPHPAS